MYGDIIREDGAKLYLISDVKNGIPLQPLVDALNKLPRPITEETWNGESGSWEFDFVTPGAKALKNPKPQFPVEPFRLKSVQLSWDHFRPEGKMPISGHTEIGRLLISVSDVSFHRKGAYNRLIQIRSELDSWAESEYSHDELPNEQFSNLYYHGENQQFSRNMTYAQCDVHVTNLNRVKALLGQYYTNSVPLKTMLKQIDLMIKSLKSWAR